MNKFKIEEKEEYIFRNIRFSKELFDSINKVEVDKLINENKELVNS